MASCHFCDNDGNTPLGVACQWGQKLPVIKFLYNARPEAMCGKNNDGRTPLGVELHRSGAVYQQDSHQMIASFLLDQFEFLVQAGQDMLPDENEQLPIHHAIVDEGIPLGTIKLLISANIGSLRYADSNGNLPLHVAFRYGKFSIVKWILERAVGGFW
ncbi:hypothetical protein ACHAWO_012976 [Cyclotella atomus]|uniref:Uncharacterized protein n=1 Tax=Cyclotella atomus TaxID=382360 RepID=A0ABD3PUH0_9STRA